MPKHVNQHFDENFYVWLAYVLDFLSLHHNTEFSTQLCTKESEEWNQGAGTVPAGDARHVDSTANTMFCQNYFLVTYLIVAFVNALPC